MRGKNEFYKEGEASLQRYMDEISILPVLSLAEELTLIPAAKSGDQEAYDRIIRSNLLFVVKIAHEYENRGMALADLISEGNFGLFRAWESFDPGRGIKFITYAKWWIRQSIVYALIYKGHLVRIPQSQIRKLHRTKEAVAALQKKLQREPMQSEISEKLGERQNTMWDLSKFPLQQEPLDAPLHGDSANRLLDILADDNEFAPDHSLDEHSLRMDLNISFAALKKREREIIKLLFGIGEARALNLGEVGQRFGISRERVRQIKNEALEKLRESQQQENTLQSYLT